MTAPAWFCRYCPVTCLPQDMRLSGPPRHLCITSKRKAGYYDLEPVDSVRHPTDSSDTVSHEIVVGPPPLG